MFHSSNNEPSPSPSKTCALMATTTITGRQRPSKPKKQAGIQKRKREDVDVEKLQRAVDELDPKSSYSKFSDLPLSEPTKAGLKACHFSGLTDIQAKAITLALKGSDILGAAKTGSGKTLAFLIPVLENLYRSQCIGMDAGLGAMIVSPTRELAIQIFDVLYKIGKCGHLFAAGLVIGGKSLQEEQHALARMNIVVCTPGRILQHLSQTAAFSVDNLQMLVLDEADRILDMGFQRDVDAIVDYLPSTRQTLLFSATQTKRVSDLARLSLRDPEYVSVHEAATSATPKTLQQNYVVTPLPSKLDTLWSFIQASKKSKLLIFLSSGKQVRFVYEAFRKMQPGIPLLHLHGRQKQTARLDITNKFAAAKHSCLFATDVVARGLDFPAIDWVVQLDCPEDADTYIHRVGRTARYERDGRAVLFLDPSEEEGMLCSLAIKKVLLERINVRAKKQQSIGSQLQAMCFKDPELKYLGQKAFTSYTKSIYVQRDKDIFAIDKYDLEGYATSLGLPGAPRIRFIKGDAEAQKRLKNAPRQAIEASESKDGSDADPDAPSGNMRLDGKKPRTKYDRMFERRNQDVLSTHYSRLKADDEDSEEASDDEAAPTALINGKGSTDLNDDLTTHSTAEDDDLFTVKRRIPPPTTTSSIDRLATSNLTTIPTLNPDSNRSILAFKSRAKAAKHLASTKHPSARSTHITFTDDGGTRDAINALLDDETALGADEAEREAKRMEYVEKERERAKVADEGDRAEEKRKKREKRLKRKEREREIERGERAGAKSELDRDESADETANVIEGLERIERPFADLADLYEDESDAQVPEVPVQRRRRQASNVPEEAVEARRSGRMGNNMRQETTKGGALPQSIAELERMATGLLA